MPSKDPEKNKKYRQDWYNKNKDKQIVRQRERRKELQDEFTAYKRTLSCADCNVSFEDHPEWVDFHHPDPSVKDMAPSRLVRYSRKRLHAEVEKCVPLCANCHRTRHATGEL